MGAAEFRAFGLGSSWLSPLLAQWVVRRLAKELGGLVLGAGEAFSPALLAATGVWVKLA